MDELNEIPRWYRPMCAGFGLYGLLGFPLSIAVVADGSLAIGAGVLLTAIAVLSVAVAGWLLQPAIAFDSPEVTDA